MICHGSLHPVIHQFPGPGFVVSEVVYSYLNLLQT